jgi:hypothetical protein
MYGSMFVYLEERIAAYSKYCSYYLISRHHAVRRSHPHHMGEKKQVPQKRQSRRSIRCPQKVIPAAVGSHGDAVSEQR